MVTVARGEAITPIRCRFCGITMAEVIRLLEGETAGEKR